MNAETLTGVVLAAISFALTVLARVQLGKSFAVTPKANDLITHGLYSRLQHPMYVFVDLTLCGIALAVHRWYVLLLLVILVPLQIRNAHIERTLLREKFGERYEIYRRATWFLRIPAKANADSEGNANGIPGRRRTVLGA
jgi:protein-S-isoprenylcysteine O-methyltransferase Ste14